MLITRSPSAGTKGSRAPKTLQPLSGFNWGSWVGGTLQDATAVRRAPARLGLLHDGGRAKGDASTQRDLVDGALCNRVGPRRAEPRAGHRLC